VSGDRLRESTDINGTTGWKHNHGAINLGKSPCPNLAALCPALISRSKEMKARAQPPFGRKLGCFAVDRWTAGMIRQDVWHLTNG
jgi:hypothetical protein